MRDEDSSALRAHLVFLYGDEQGRATFNHLIPRLESFNNPHRPVPPLDQHDTVLITYADQVTQPEQNPLETLNEFCRSYLTGLISSIHLLPFYPSSSDDGFSVIDYLQVDPHFGTWEDISRLGGSFRLMFDAVINHISQYSSWFQAFLDGNPHYQDICITIPPGGQNLSQVVRPRALPLLTPFQTRTGETWVWTTFSADQVDLNYRNPQVLLDIIEILLEYVVRGAQIIRLDAIAFLWKEPGTVCIHLPQTHHIIQLFRKIFSMVAPGTLLITETNVPHRENVSYFGNGTNEAHLVYNFALPPLVLHAFLTGQAGVLSEWASSLVLPSPEVAFFNFLASHDGIGINPVRGILPKTDIDALVQAVLDRGGLVSSKSNPDRSVSPYELNINYFDALSDPNRNEPVPFQVKRFLASQAILLAMPGLPGIYVHSLFGSQGWLEGVKQSGQNRTINRQKFARNTLVKELEQTNSRRSRIFTGYAQMLKARRTSPAFNPYGAHQVLFVGEAIFALLRTDPSGNEQVLCLHNISPVRQDAHIDLAQIGRSHSHAQDLLGQGQFDLSENPVVTLDPYQAMWLGLR